jgi:nickel superoxide dismutase
MILIPPIGGWWSKYSNLHDLFWMVPKTVGNAKKSNDVNIADRLLSEIDAIAEIFWATNK